MSNRVRDIAILEGNRKANAGGVELHELTLAFKTIWELKEGNLMDSTRLSALDMLCRDIKGVGVNNSVYNLWDKETDGVKGIVELMPIIGESVNDSMFLKLRDLTSGVVSGTIVKSANTYKSNGTDGYVTWGKTAAQFYGGINKVLIGEINQIVSESTDRNNRFNVGLNGANSWANGIQAYVEFLYIFAGDTSSLSIPRAGSFVSLFGQNRRNTNTVSAFRNNAFVVDLNMTFVQNDNTTNLVTAAGNYASNYYGFYDGFVGVKALTYGLTNDEFLALMISINAFNTAIGR